MPESKNSIVDPSIITYERKEYFAPLIPEVEDWPINKLTHDRAALVDEVEQVTFDHLTRKNDKFLHEIIEKTIYQEQTRMKEDPWRIDPPNDNLFWKRIRKDLDHDENGINKNGSKPTTVKATLKQVIHRYAEEIVGTFSVRTYHQIRKILTVLFRRLLARSIDFKSLFSGKRKTLLDRLKVYGPIDEIRQLARKGTLVILPTHSSNLDSVLIGYTNDMKAGLPLMAYGAGLNLYNFAPAAYFMNRLGAYRVDRRKKNAIYLATLGTMSRLAIEKGTNSSFFPGGTRSRSGELEQKLKLGLLSTVIDAQRNLLHTDPDRKIYVIPMVVSYHFVLEAKSLIEQHLRKTGKEKYVYTKNELTSFTSWFKFLRQFISKSSEISISYGRPLDVMGNFIDTAGNSIDERGTRLNLRDYFVSENKISPNTQRESVYTRRLADIVARRYKAENIILTSHLVSYVAFQLLQHSRENLDLFGILALPDDEYFFNFDAFVQQTALVVEKLAELAANDKLKLPEIFLCDVEEIVNEGLKRLGTYHSRQPLKKNKRGDIYSQDFRLLFFYHNRIASYDFSRDIDWKSIPVIYQVD